MIISPASGLIKGENSLVTTMVVMRLLHVEVYPVHYGQIPEKHLLSGTKTTLDRRLRLHLFRAAGIRFWLKGGQEGINILVGEFLGLIGLYGLILDHGETQIQVLNQAIDIRWCPGYPVLPEPTVT